MDASKHCIRKCTAGSCTSAVTLPMKRPFASTISVPLTWSWSTYTRLSRPSLSLQLQLTQRLRYGENPHQVAALYGEFREFFEQLHGKELSYNNILDLTSAAKLIQEFSDAPPTVAILKHTNPCGLAQGSTLRLAWDQALATDRQAPFGGIIAANKELDAEVATAIAE